MIDFTKRLTKAGIQLFSLHNRVGWGCRIHQLQRGKTPPTKSPGYKTKQSYGKAPVIQEFWGMCSTPSLPSLPGPLWPRMIAPERVLSIAQIELDSVLEIELFLEIATAYLCLTELLEITLFWYLAVSIQKTILILNWIVWNRTI